MKSLRRGSWFMLAPLLLIAGACGYSAAVLPTDPARETAEIQCRNYGSYVEARKIAEEWIAGHKSKYQEVIRDVSWENDLWSIGFPMLPNDKRGYASVTLLPGGEVIRCEATEKCIVAPPPEKPACPVKQERIATKTQAIEFATRFLEEQAIPVNHDILPQVLGGPAWWVFVEQLPPMPGGHYTLLISADGEVVDTLPGM